MKSYDIEDLFKTSWLELTTEQIAYVVDANLQMKAAREKEQYDHAGYLAIMILRKLRKNKSAVAKIEVEQVVDCINDLNFLNDPWYFFPQLKLTEAGLSERPEDYLKNHTLEQLYYIDSLYSKYIIQDYIESRAHPPQNPSPIAEAFLNEMIGVIYTRGTHFDPAKVEERGKAVAKIENFEKAVVIMTYGNLKQFIVTQCPNLFPTSEEESDKPQESKAPEDSEPMWQSLLFDLSETPAYPGMAQAKRANMYEALSYLEKKAKDFKPKPQPANA